MTFKDNTFLLTYLGQFPLAVCPHCGELVCAFETGAEGVGLELQWHIDYYHTNAAERARELEEQQRRARRKDGHRRQLQAILNGVVTDVQQQKQGSDGWKYMRFGLSLVGNAVLGAMESAGMDRVECMDKALSQP